MNALTNLFNDVPGELPTELVETLLAARELRIERIVSRGHASPPGFWYNQPDHEWVLVVQGAAWLRFDDEPQPVEMKPGDCLSIPAHRRHRVDWTDPAQPTIWLAVRYRDPPAAS